MGRPGSPGEARPLSRSQACKSIYQGVAGAKKLLWGWGWGPNRED